MEILVFRVGKDMYISLLLLEHVSDKKIMLQDKPPSTPIREKDILKYFMKINSDLLFRKVYLHIISANRTRLDNKIYAAKQTIVHACKAALKPFWNISS